MSEQVEKLIGQIRKCIVNDYFTPTIRAEVILDTLLTPYVDRIVNRQLNLHTVFVAKEMSIYEEIPDKKERQNNRGPKIDYVLADEDTVYLVELKTTDGSIKAKQAERYIDSCYGKTFGEVFGGKLLQIMAESAEKAKIGKLTQEKEDALYEAFIQVTGKGNSGPYAGRARRFLKREKCAGTDKYLYTMGQLLDYLYDEKNGQKKADIWDKPLRLIYLTPDGCEIITKKTYQKNRRKWEEFYLDPLQPGGKGSVSLRKFADCLSDADAEDGLAQLLKEIFQDVY